MTNLVGLPQPEEAPMVEYRITYEDGKTENIECDFLTIHNGFAGFYLEEKNKEGDLTSVKPILLIRSETIDRMEEL